LSFFGFGLLALARPRFAWTAAPKRTKQDPLGSRLEVLLRHKESAIIIGREYLHQVPQEKDRQILLDLISSGCGERAFDSDGDQLRDRLRLRTRQDFEEGQIIRIHGWILSVTEARLCALAALVL
jgi:hypothetical protein